MRWTVINTIIILWFGKFNHLTVFGVFNVSSRRKFEVLAAHPLTDWATKRFDIQDLLWNYPTVLRFMSHLNFSAFTDGSCIHNSKHRIWTLTNLFVWIDRRHKAWGPYNSTTNQIYSQVIWFNWMSLSWILFNCFN